MSTVIVNDVRYKSLPQFMNRKAAEQLVAEIALWNKSHRRSLSWALLRHISLNIDLCPMEWKSLSVSCQIKRLELGTSANIDWSLLPRLLENTNNLEVLLFPEHKTGRTKPISLDATQKGCKKIMVLYITPARGSKAEKTNWVMHRYHLGIGEDEKEGDYILSKIFYQQHVKVGEKSELDFLMDVDTH
ncbi:hypothetical protein ACFE04_022149 [Oxalis oulophora]